MTWKKESLVFVSLDDDIDNTTTVLYVAKNDRIEYSIYVNCNDENTPQHH